MLTKWPFWFVDVKRDASGFFLLADISYMDVLMIGEADNCWEKYCEGRGF
jgi:hypothetical protein